MIVEQSNRKGGVGEWRPAPLRSLVSVPSGRITTITVSGCPVVWSLTPFGSCGHFVAFDNEIQYDKATMLVPSQKYLLWLWRPEQWYAERLRGSRAKCTFQMLIFCEPHLLSQEILCYDAFRVRTQTEPRAPEPEPNVGYVCACKILPEPDFENVR